MNKQTRKDILVRGLWTLVQAAIGVAITVVADLDVVWAVPIATALSFVKSWVATKFGDPGTVTFTAPPEA